MIFRVQSFLLHRIILITGNKNLKGIMGRKWPVLLERSVYSFLVWYDLLYCYNICRRCRDIEPFFWKISQYLGSGWHNWSPNVATVTGWTKCFTKDTVPVLRDTLYKQSSLDQEQCWFMWNCLVTALGNLLIFPIDMYLIYVTVSVFYFAISLESLLSSSWS